MPGKEDADIELLKSHLSNPGTHLWLGGLVCKQLQAMGTITLFLSEDDGKVRIANPLHVYLGSQAMIDEDSDDRPFRWLRPVVGEAKPQFVAWRNGDLWEIEFTDEKSVREGESD
jgi:hypothetical protein